MPIGQSRRAGTGIFADSKMIPSLVKQGWFPMKCTLQDQKETGRSSAGTPIIEWDAVENYANLPCRKYDRLPHEDRTLDIIEEIKYWTIALGGYYPGIDPAWRVLVVDTGEIFHMDGVDSDSLHLVTVLTCRLFTPLEEPGI